MFKAVKYATTGSVENTRRKGNFLVGESTIAYGPTSVTGFYSRVSPVDGGYTVYVFNESATGDLSYYSLSNNEELINLVNSLSQESYTTPFQALDWIRSQSNYVADPDYFEFTVKTNNSGVSTSSQFKLPLVSDGTINFSIDWGDSSIDVITTYNQAETTHTYSSAGTYTIKIAGIIKGFQFNNGGDCLKFLEIKNWGCLNISKNSTFNGCQNLTCTAVDSPLITTTDLSSCFQICTLFNGNIGNWDISNVTNLNRFLFGCQNFNQNLNNLNTSKVTNMRQLFYTNFIFNQPINNWDVSEVTDMFQMFEFAQLFNQPLNNWNTSKVTTMGNMFNQAKAFNQDISNWDVSLVENMSFMFAQNTVFNQPIGRWNTPSLQFLSNTFNNCDSFNQDISNLIITGVSNFFNFMASATGLSTENYDKLLISWESQTPQSNKNINFGGSKYTLNSAASTARQSLISNFGWTITDGGGVS